MKLSNNNVIDYRVTNKNGQENDAASLILPQQVSPRPRSVLQLIESFDTSLTIAFGDSNMDKLIMTCNVFFFFVLYQCIISELSKGTQIIPKQFCCWFLWKKRRETNMIHKITSRIF